MPERGQRKTNDPPNECRPSTKLSLPPRHSYLCNPRPHSLKWRHEALVWMRHVCGHLCERGRLAGVTACEGVACYPVGECECAMALSLSRRACSIMRTGASPRTAGGTVGHIAPIPQPPGAQPSGAVRHPARHVPLPPRACRVSGRSQRRQGRGSTLDGSRSCLPGLRREGET